MYAIVQDGQVQATGELAYLFPNTSFGPSADPDWLSQNNVYEIIEGERKDERYYWVTFDKYEVAGDVVVRSYVNTPKALEDVTETVNETTSITKGLKSAMIAQVKASTNSKLASTDWMVTRWFERDIPLSPEVTAERAAIIAECNRLEAAIQGATDVEALMAVIQPQPTEQGGV